eukprot:PITA_23952
MKEGRSIANHLNAFNTLLVQLESIEVKIPSEDKAITLLCSLPDSWDHFVTSISISSSKAIEFDDVVASLLSEETRRRSHSETSTSEAMMVRGRSKERRLRKPSDSRSKSKGKKSKLKCWFCGKSGNLKKECWKRQQQTSKANSSIEKKEANATDTDGSRPIEEAPETSLRRSTRIKRPLRRYDDYVTSVAFTANDNEPLCYQEAIEGLNSDKWKAAMKDEMMALGKNCTWDLVQLPKRRKIVGCKWVFKLKRGVNDTEDRYKAWLVAKGFSQKADINFHEIFSPVVKIVSIRIVLALVALLELEL